MSNITIRPMEPEDWNAVSEIYLEGIATEHATFQTTCPPYTAWDAFHIKECRLVILDGGELAGWAALRRVDPRWCYRGVVEVSIYVGEQFRGRGVGFHLLTALCADFPAHLLIQIKTAAFSCKKYFIPICRFILRKQHFQTEYRNRMLTKILFL